MAFKLKGAAPTDTVEFELKVGDGDLEIYANGVMLGFIDTDYGKLFLTHLSEDEREKLPGLSLSNGRLTVAA